MPNLELGTLRNVGLHGVCWRGSSTAVRLRTHAGERPLGVRTVTPTHLAVGPGRELGKFVEISIFTPNQAPPKGPKSDLAAPRGQPLILCVLRAHLCIKCPFCPRSCSICTETPYFDVVGARQAARHRPLGGREGAGIGGALVANVHRGVPGRIVMCQPNLPCSLTGRRGSGPEPFAPYPRNPHCYAENVLSEHTVRRIPQHLGGRAAIPGGS